jgi:hypothetical protein
MAYRDPHEGLAQLERHPAAEAAATLYISCHGLNLQSELMRTLVAISALLVAAGIAGTWWAVGQLADGATELPQHWWSTAPLALVALGLALGLTAARSSR